MNVRLIYRKIEHHAGHSGYDLLAKYVDGIDYRPGLLYKLASKIPERVIRKIKAFNSDWYRRESLYTELELFGRTKVPAKRLYHFLYGEDVVRLSTKWRPRLNNKLVASFHQPPAVFEELPFFKDKRFLKNLDGVVTLCGDQEQYFQQYMPSSRVFRVPHGVDIEYWQPDESVESRPEPTFLFVGWWQRDIELFKAVVQKVHERDQGIRFRVVTFKHLWEHFEDLPAVTLLSGISDDELMHEYRANTALFLPLKEVTANNAVLETMACGTPVIATDKGGLPEYVNDRCAIKVPPGDVDAAVEAILSLAGDREKALEMGRAARVQAEKFDWRVVGRRMTYIYRRILGHKCPDFFDQHEEKPRNVCLLTEEYPPESGWGGIGTHNYNLAHGLVRAGHKVFVIAGGGDNTVADQDGIQVHRVAFDPRNKLQRWAWNKWVKPYLAKRYVDFLRRLEFGLAARKKFKVLQMSEPLHVVETPEYYGTGYFLKKVAKGCPVVVKLHTPTELNCHLNSMPVTRDVKLSSIFEKNSTRRADLVCSPSRKMMDAARDKWMADLGPVELIENPIDTRLFNPGENKWEGGTKVFLFSGRLEYRKGVQVLVEAFDRIVDEVPDVEIHFAGHDTPTFMHEGTALFFKDYLEKVSLKEATLERCKFLGRKDRTELIELYQSAYASLIPSQSFENFPYSCLEAMSCGNAVIVTELGGMTEMAEDGVCGIHVKANDSVTLAEAIKTMALDPEKTLAMGEASRRVVVERYSTEAMTQKALQAYERLIRSASYR